MLELEELLQTRAICETEYSYVLFHGTSEEFNRVDFSHSDPYTDFGKGFYLTTILEQAVEWAGKKRRRKVKRKRLQDIPLTYVIKYELVLEQLKNLEIKIYGEYSEEWLDKIYECRTEGRKITDQNDITIGPMADNNVKFILDQYEAGKIGKSETLKLLKFEKANMQIAFHTDKSLGAIKFIDKTIKFF